MAQPRKLLLAALTRGAAGSLVTVDLAAKALRLSKGEAARTLARLTHAGWLARVQRGVYAILPLDVASEATTTADDPWVLAARLYAPSYIGGWTAAEHWELTEQLFRSTFVVTAANIRARNATVLGAEFHLVHVVGKRLDVSTDVWRTSGGTRVRVVVSDRERTLIDAARHPAWVGGIRHLAEIFSRYAQSRHADATMLAGELARAGNGAAAKRIGYLTEILWPSAARVTAQAQAMRSRGVVALDPAVPRRGRLYSRWGLWLNAPVSEGPTT